MYFITDPLYCWSTGSSEKILLSCEKVLPACAWLVFSKTEPFSAQACTSARTKLHTGLIIFPSLNESAAFSCVLRSSLLGATLGSLIGIPWLFGQTFLRERGRGPSPPPPLSSHRQSPTLLCKYFRERVTTWTLTTKMFAATTTTIVSLSGEFTGIG